MSAAFLTFPYSVPLSRSQRPFPFNFLSRFCCQTVNKQRRVSGFRTLPTARSRDDFTRLAATIALAATFIISPIQPAHSVSGGGQDYASKDYTNADFSDGSYEGKDFSGATLRGSTFRNAKLKNTRFFKADLREADMTGADLSFSTLEGGYLKGLNLGNAVLESAYTSDSIADVANFEGADFTDALVPTFLLPKLCGRQDVKGVNSLTNVNTRESLMCPD